MNSKKTHSAASPEIASINVLTTKQELEKLQILAAELDCQNLAELINKGFFFLDFLNESRKKNCGVFVVDLDKTKIAQSDNRTIMMTEIKEGIIDLKQEMDEKIALDKRVKQTNAYSQVFKA